MEGVPREVATSTKRDSHDSLAYDVQKLATCYQQVTQHDLPRESKTLCQEEQRQEDHEDPGICKGVPYLLTVLGVKVYIQGHASIEFVIEKIEPFPLVAFRAVFQLLRPPDTCFAKLRITTNNYHCLSTNSFQLQYN